MIWSSPPKVERWPGNEGSPGLPMIHKKPMNQKPESSTVRCEYEGNFLTAWLISIIDRDEENLFGSKWIGSSEQLKGGKIVTTEGPH